MSTNNVSELLYPLLPTFYRQQDLLQGQPLKALLGVLEKELSVLQHDLDQSYKDAFIETCAEWVVPYLADLLGIYGLDNAQRIIDNQRARVANTIRYRRRKGQAAVVERIVRDVTGWYIKVSQFFQSLSITQNMRHLLPNQGMLASIRDLNNMETLNTAFDQTAHTVDVLDLTSRKIKYKTNQVGIFIWRLNSYGILDCPMVQAKDESGDPIDGCFYINPLGQDLTLFNKPQLINELAQQSQEVNLPVALRTQAVMNDLQDQVENNAAPLYYGDGYSFCLKNSNTPIDAKDIVITDLSNWNRPSDSKIAIDIKRGRVAFPTNSNSTYKLTSSYSYGFSANLGGGPYDRRESITTTQQTDTIYFSVNASSTDTGTYHSIEEALQAWNSSNVNTGVIQIQDNQIYSLNNAAYDLNIAQGKTLIIEAADGKRPVIKSNININIQSSGTTTTIPTCRLNGLLIDGSITIAVPPTGTNNNLNLEVIHCTLVPKSDSASLTVENENALGEVNISFEKSITGALILPNLITSLKLSNSIIKGMFLQTTQLAVAANIEPNNLLMGPLTQIDQCTIFGEVHVSALPSANNSIFTHTVVVQNPEGCMRYCSLPLNSQTPQRYRCQPEYNYEIEAEKLITDSDLNSVDELSPSDKNFIITNLTPSFSSMNYNDPNFAQLSDNCNPAISAGAENGAEMGAFNMLKQPQRLLNLQQIMTEFLPFGLNYEIFYIS